MSRYIVPLVDIEEQRTKVQVQKGGKDYLDRHTELFNLFMQMKI